MRRIPHAAPGHRLSNQEALLTDSQPSIKDLERLFSSLLSPTQPEQLQRGLQRAQALRSQAPRAQPAEQALKANSSASSSARSLLRPTRKPQARASPARRTAQAMWLVWPQPCPPALAPPLRPTQRSRATHPHSRQSSPLQPKPLPLNKLLPAQLRQISHLHPLSPRGGSRISIPTLGNTTTSTSPRSQLSGNSPKVRPLSTLMRLPCLLARRC